jgi:hypothetical protein
MRLLTVGTLLGVLAIPAVASAHAGNNDPNVVHACVGNVSKIVRIVGVGGSCVSRPALLAETAVHWQVEGPQGAPGTNGTNGVNGVNGINGTNGIDGARLRPNPPCYDNDNRYVDCGNGTVTDTVTGLTWLKAADCLGYINWADANRAADALADGQCGLTDKSSPGDWRLPTKDEWTATTARAYILGCAFAQPTPPFTPPSLTNDVGIACLSAGPSSFTGVKFLTSSDAYWSRSSDDHTPSVAWIMYLGAGFTGFDRKIFNRWVWPVRAR